MTSLADVRRMFAHAPDHGARIRTNPVTGGEWMPGLDSTEFQIRKAYRALQAQTACAQTGLTGKYKLPLTYAEREKLKSQGGMAYGVSLFARSLAEKDYRLSNHPSFDVYMWGLLATPLGPRLIADDPTLADRFPPAPMVGLDQAGQFRRVRMRRSMGCPNVRHRP